MKDSRIICFNFLRDLDEFLRENLDNLTCSDINKMYSNFFMELKDFKGNSNGFSGLSEYIIFRFIFHLLGGFFDRKLITATELYEFVSKDGIYVIGQNTPFMASSRKYYPDIVVYKKNVPVLVVEIKIYPTYGTKTIIADINKLNEMISGFPSARGLFISYYKIPVKGKMHERLIEEVNLNDRLDYLVLGENDSLFKDNLQKFLRI
jgi:Holliday junction resolvase